MIRWVAALMIFATPVFAQTATPAQDCKPGSQATGSTDCAKPENKQTEVKPAMPATYMKETVIPKSGAQQSPETTPTTGTNK